MNDMSPPEFQIRPYRPDTSDRSACGRICCLTGNAGKDATGLLSSDDLWGEVWVLPYLDKHPEYAWVVEATPAGSGSTHVVAGASGRQSSREGDERVGEVVGYIVGTPDTASFEDHFHHTHWPAQQRRFPATGVVSGKEQSILQYASARGTDHLPEYVQRYPAHLHINLLSEAQGRGLGRDMIRTLLDALRRDGIKGLHLGASAENDGACAFYRKMGFGEVPGKEGERVFVRDL